MYQTVKPCNPRRIIPALKHYAYKEDPHSNLARVLDRDRTNLSVSQYLEKLKAQDPTTKKRLRNE